MREKIRWLYDAATDRINNIHISKVRDVDRPLLLISERYPGLWMEHTYDSVMLARLDPSYIPLAESAILLFVERQRPSGQLPFSVMDRNKRTDLPEGGEARYAQIQECVSFFTLALEVYKMNGDRDFLEKIYLAGCAWDGWLRKYRMTTGRGLIEMFVGYDTGHDESGRLEGMAYKRNFSVDGVVQDADKRPPDDGVTPILAVDMNAHFYGDERALAEMAELLGKDDEAAMWERSAAAVKEKIFEHLYDERDAFFYDVDVQGRMRKYRSSTIFHLFQERVLDKTADRELIDRIYREHIKNPDEFWTPYPFPAMAINDPSNRVHRDFNCWGYYTQGLIVLRCSRWMDEYGYSADYDHILTKWVEAFTEHSDKIMFSQELDPISGVPTGASEWYSTTMIVYIYAVRRLGLV